MNDDVVAVLVETDRTIGRDPDGWKPWPGGWPDDVESALIDAVFSARAVYRTRHGRGVHRLVTDWQERRSRSGRPHGLTGLIAEIDDAGGAAEWGRTVVRNEQHSPGRGATAPHGPTKAATVRDAAQRLVDSGIRTAADAGPATRTVLLKVNGIGVATANYTLMLLGESGVKPDRMVHRFVERALGRDRLRQKDVEQLVTAVAAELSSPDRRVPPRVLDHAIWSYESARSADSPRGRAR